MSHHSGSHSRDDPDDEISQAGLTAWVSQVHKFGNLIVSRLKGEAIIVSLMGIPICRISVADVRGDKVRIGCEAGPQLSIDRESIYAEKLQESNLTLNEKDEVSKWLINNKAR